MNGAPALVAPAERSIVGMKISKETWP